MEHNTQAWRTYSWLGEGDPTRVDSAAIRLEPGRLVAHGTSRTAEYASSWSLTTTRNWQTQQLLVSVYGDGWNRHLTLTRGPDGTWTAETRQSGLVALPEPGIADPSRLAGAVDCDLAFCPVTNTMPILRLGLLHDASVVASLDMAFVRMPSLQVVSAVQRYSGVEAYEARKGAAVVRYESGSFRADITVDADGVVLDYPAVARRQRV
jgi:hypothetical protein